MWNPHEPVSSGQRYGLGAAGLLTALVVWSVLAVSGVVRPEGALVTENSYFLPAPWEVLGGLGEMLQAEKRELNLGWAALASVKRVAMALVAVVVIGLPVGILMGSSSKVNAFLGPLVDPLRSAPVVAVLPIIVLWFGIDEKSKVVFLWLGASVFFIPMVRDAIAAVPQHHLTLARDLGATPFEAIRHSVIPLAMPRIVDAVIVAVGIEWTYITVAEFVNAREGLGYLIQTHKRLGANYKVFGGILVILLLALVTDQLLKLAKRKLYPWETE